MIVDAGQVLPRLMGWGLVDERAIVEGDLEIRSAARRNRNLRLDRRRGPGYLIKEPEPDSRQTLRAEARFYQYCRREPRVAALVPLMARLHAFYAEEPVLVVEIVDGSRSLHEELRVSSLAEIPHAPARALGRALAIVHSTFRDLDPDADPYLAELGTVPPSTFMIHRPAPGLLRRLSPAKRCLLEIVQSDAAIVAGLDAAAKDWQIETLIHGDVRFGNVLVVDAEDDGDAEVRLIDWELVQRGDPAWDVAGAFHDFLRFWLLGMPLAPDLESMARVDEAVWPLAAVQPAVRSFWRQYRAAAGLDRRQSAGFLRRAAGMCGARLVQAAWEHSRRATRLTSLGVLLLQLAANVLRDPGAAATDLLGLSAET